MTISPLASIAALGMTQKIKIKPYLGPTGNGGRLYDTERTYLCRIQEDEKPIFTATGQQVVSTSSIEIFPRAIDGTELAALSPDAFITLPDGTAPRILRAGGEPDIEGGTIKWIIHT